MKVVQTNAHTFRNNNVAFDELTIRMVIVTIDWFHQYHFFQNINKI